MTKIPRGKNVTAMGALRRERPISINSCLCGQDAHVHASFFPDHKWYVVICDVCRRSGELGKTIYEAISFWNKKNDSGS